MVKFRFTLGLTPEETIRKCLPESYEMDLNSEDYKLFAKIVNIGIDSNLQAICADPIVRPGFFSHKAHIELDRESMVCLLNRLYDYSEFGDYANESLLEDSEKFEAYNLRSDILTTIGIEEI